MEDQRISFRYTSKDVEECVREWFGGHGTERRKLDGDRSVRIPHPEKRGFDIKIKGAGFRGGPIQFGTFHRTGPVAPWFDFDGRMAEDIASGHDNAFQGGASFQQAATEYAVTGSLARLGFPVVPCIGFGRVDVRDQSSWFSLFAWDRSWKNNVIVPKISIEEFAAASLQIGQLLLKLALEHDLIGHCWYVRASDGSYLIKDVHPFRQADPVSMSQLSWVMQLLFSIHIRCLAALHYPVHAKSQNVPEHIQAFPFRAVLPDATKSDHEELRWSIVAEYMLRVPKSFSARELSAALRRNRISSRLLDLCPERFARYDG